MFLKIRKSSFCSINRIVKLFIVTLIIGALVLALVFLCKSFLRSAEKNNDGEVTLQINI